MTSGKIVRKSSRNSRTVHKARRRRSALKALLFLLLAAGSAYSAFQIEASGYFTVKEITTGETVYMDRAGLDSLCRELFTGKNILWGLEEGKERLALRPMVKRVRCSRRFPDRLEVSFEERRPVALANTGELLPVDEEGYVLPLDMTRYHFDLPVITPGEVSPVVKEEGTERMRLGSGGIRLLEAVLQFRARDPEMLDRVSEFSLNDQDKITLVTVDRGLCVVMGKWIKAKNISYLKWMLDELSGREDVPELVDLSFEGQIVVRNHKDG